MELCEGGELSEEMIRSRMVDDDYEKAVASYLSKMAYALEHCHA